MLQTRKFDVDKTTFLFSKEVDDNSRLISQSETIYYWEFPWHKDYHKIDKFNPCNVGDDEYLCHETSKDLLGDIVGKGLIPSVGDIYRGYWLRGRECNELYNLLQPGVFLMRGRTSFHTYYRQPVKLYVKLEGLDMDSLYVDHAFPKEQSVFYTKQIPAEDLFIKKRKEGKTVMVPLMEKVKLC